MDLMTAPSQRDRSLSPPSPTPDPSASDTVRFPSAAAYVAALEAVSSKTRAESHAHHAESAAAMRALRVLLEENLSALRAVYEDQRRTIASALRTVDTARNELQALGQPDAPWVSALDQTRALIRAAFADLAAQHANRR
jgi:hypothetical protein